MTHRPNPGLTNQVALITGAARGVGREAARLFAAAGAKVVVNDPYDAAGQVVVDTIRASGGEAILVRVDAASFVGAEAMIRVAEETFGGLDVLFNHAGHGDAAVATHLKSTYLGCKFGIPALQRAGGGAIINAVPSVPGKGGALGLTRELALVHARDRIRVNAIGGCGTPLEIAQTALFLGSQVSSFVTGATFHMDGAAASAYA